MKYIRMSCVLISCVVIGSLYSPAHAHSVTQEQQQVDDLFDPEDENDVFAQEAAQTTIMQQEIEIQSPSMPMYVLFKVWDTILCGYLYAQGAFSSIMASDDECDSCTS